MIAGSAVAAWRLSIGFTLGLPFAYLLAASRRSGDRLASRGARLDAGLVLATVAGAVLFAAVGFALSPLLRVADAHRRRAARRHGGGLLGAAADLPGGARRELIWGGATAPLRDGLENVPEKTLFPGLVILALAIAGLSSSVFPRWLRRGLGAGVVAVSILALGFRAGGGLLWPYRIVYDVLPGWQAIRVPGRLVALSSLGLALLAGAGAQRAMLGGAARECPGGEVAPRSPPSACWRS